MESESELLARHNDKHTLSPSVCGKHIGNLDITQRSSIVTELLFERLKRKGNDIMEILQSTSYDWSEALHIILFRFVCGSHNLVAAERLARMVNSHIVMRENSSLEQIEALLLGSAGLLDIYDNDSYIQRLRQEFEHLATKYGITPLAPSEWQLTGMYIHNHPVLRIAQLAACLNKNNISLNTILNCRTRNDVLSLLNANASPYWVDNFLPGSHPVVSRRIGSFKSDIIGINLVAPIMYAYGTYTNSSEIVSHALALLENIPAESNRYMKEWQHYGVMPFNASESQALLQLSRVYCEPKCCNRCPVSKYINYNRKQ